MTDSGTPVQFAGCRNRFLERMEDGGILFMFAGAAPQKRGDAFYEFSPQRNFYYMTGIDAPNVAFMLRKERGAGACSGAGLASATLFLERRDEVAVKWTGEPLGIDEAMAASGANECRYLDEFRGIAQRALFGAGGKPVYMDLESRGLDLPLTPELAFAQEIRTRFPAVRLLDAYPIFSELRAIKQPWEAECIRKAVACTAEGLALAMANARPGMPEHGIEAYFDFALKKRGMRHAFTTIAASGANAAVLHYDSNDSVARDGDLVLMDLGAEFQRYASDVTRTFPVNGRFSPRQAELYGIVLEANEKVIAAIEPGRPWAELNKIVLDHYAVELPKVGLMAKGDDVSRYYYHGVSHPIGLETHDIGRGSHAELMPGMALTVEPGLYVAEEGIGIRIEDDVLVTPGGREVLTSAIPKAIAAIEAAMARGREHALE